MAKRATAADAVRSNGYDSQQLKGFIEKIEGYFAEIESAKAVYMKRSRDIRESISIVYEEAKALGIPKKELKAFVDARKLEEKKARILERFEDTSELEAMAEALGDFATLPLGMAALKRQASLEDIAALESLN